MLDHLIAVSGGPVVQNDVGGIAEIAARAETVRETNRLPAKLLTIMRVRAAILTSLCVTRKRYHCCQPLSCFIILSPDLSSLEFALKGEVPSLSSDLNERSTTHKRFTLSTIASKIEWHGGCK